MTPPDWIQLDRGDVSIIHKYDPPRVHYKFEGYDYVPLDCGTYIGMAGADGVPSVTWMEACNRHDGAKQIKDYYHIHPSDGFWVVGPRPDDRPWWPPIDSEGNNYITVYQHHKEIGIRFPLHPFLQFILCEYKVSIFRITPQSLRGVIGFIWCCEFFEFPLTMPLFQACFRLKRINPNGGWCSFYNGNGTHCSVPKLKDIKNWKGSYFFVRVPTSVGHPNCWYAILV